MKYNLGTNMWRHTHTHITIERARAQDQTSNFVNEHHTLIKTNFAFTFFAGFYFNFIENVVNFVYNFKL